MLTDDVLVRRRGRGQVGDDDAGIAPALIDPGGLQARVVDDAHAGRRFLQTGREFVRGLAGGGRQHGGYLVDQELFGLGVAPQMHDPIGHGSGLPRVPGVVAPCREPVGLTRGFGNGPDVVGAHTGFDGCFHLLPQEYQGRAG